MGELSARRGGHRCHLETQVGILAGELDYEFFIFGVQVRDSGTWRPGLYTEFRYESREHSGLAWGAISRKLLGFASFPRLPC